MGEITKRKIELSSTSGGTNEHNITAPKDLSLPENIVTLEMMPVRISDVLPMGGRSYLVKFKYFSEKKCVWVSQMAPYLVENLDGELTGDEYGKLITYIIALAASIEDYMVVEPAMEGTTETETETTTEVKVLGK